jgi:hypothetical protein
MTYFDTLALWQRDPRLLLANDENVALPCGERVVNCILDMHNIEATIMSLTVSNDTYSAHVTTTSNHGNHTGVELDVICDFTRSQIDLDRIIDLDNRVWVSDSVSPCQHLHS